MLSGLLAILLFSGIGPRPSQPRLTAAVIPGTAGRKAADSRTPAWQPTRRNPPRAAAADEGAAILADDGGAIAEIQLHYSSDSEPELGPVFRDLFAALPGGVRLLICCPTQDSIERFAAEWAPLATAQGRDVHVVNVNRPISVWARDRRIARQAANAAPAASFVPTAHSTYDDEKHNDLLLQTLIWPTGLVPAVALTSFYLEGGNVVANRRHLFVGGNMLADNENRFADQAQLNRELARMFGREPIPLQAADGEVPWCHVDMYLTPLDDRTLLLASPAQGVALMGGQTAIKPVTDATAEEGRGDEMQADESGELEFDPVEPHSAVQQRFDDVADQLTGLGYRVLRLPALMNVGKDWMVTYNNVLMDRRGDRRVIYMPIYQIPELDRAAEQAYRNLGFEVHTLDVSQVFQLGGAVRCLINVTARKPLRKFGIRSEPKTEPGLHYYEVDPPPAPIENHRRRAVDSTTLLRPLSDVLGGEAIEDD